VFRSVLDGRARMVTIALSHDMWVAYDAGTCSLYKAWKGGVHFDGAVYTTVHGPQPTSIGSTYVEGTDAGVWFVTLRDGAAQEIRPRWRGYSLTGGQVHLRYEFALNDGAIVRVEETPEFARPEKLFDEPESQAPWLSKGLVGLRRTFTAEGLPQGANLSVAIRAECAGYLMERLVDVEDSEVQLADGAKGRRVSGKLPLNSEQPRNDLMLFFRPAPELPEPKQK